MRHYIEFHSLDGLSLRDRNPYMGHTQPHELRRTILDKRQFAISDDLTAIAMTRTIRDRRYVLTALTSTSYIYTETE